MKLYRVKFGLYKSVDGRVVIRRVASRQTRRNTDVCWSLTINGKELPVIFFIKKDALRFAERKLSKAAGSPGVS